ncbi:hypothetical protein [Thermodesulfobacterium hydrogeniphilum]|uniref:hypothetical protein n=1 Tax=Thermodesulfobacterium hydrogeniphilum TaxID=161156 RepID=UPI000571A886|nr:hypothetical protein [Thermodesulfobacterium hydrogeniphilum]
MGKKLKTKAYILITVIIFMAVIALIGAGLALMTQYGYFSTRSVAKFDKLQKGAQYGMIEAVRRITNSGGICENASFNINKDGININVKTARNGLVCYVRSEAFAGNSKVVVVGTTQGFYGIGTYTVKGEVNANIQGGLISGCDNTNNCSIPGFIASGNVIVNTYEKTCDQSGNIGVFGNPPVKEKVPFFDLVPLSFNANCFYELLNILEKESNSTSYPMGLGSNPFWMENGTARQDITFNKGGLNSCPIPPFDEANTVMGKLTVNFPDIPNISSSCQINENRELHLNLKTMIVSGGSSTIDLSNCTQILINSGTGKLNITGKSSKMIYIYTTSNNGISISGAENGTLINDTTSEVDVNSSFNPFVIYSKGKVSLNNVSYIRVISLKDINIKHPYISYSTLITQKDIENYASNLNLYKVNIFAKRFLFGSFVKVNIEGGLLYLYTLADRPRSNNVVLKGCYPIGWWPQYDCAWIGKSLKSVNIGTPENPVLIILVNSATWIGSTNTVNINGILFGEGVTYLEWYGVNKQNYRGILIRNFPNNETLNINIGGDISLLFDYGIINTLNQEFWFVRRFECIKDDPMPRIQIIQTTHSSY